MRARDRAKAFRGILAQLKWTQKQLAEQLDISERQIRRYAAGAKVPLTVLLAITYLKVTQ